MHPITPEARFSPHLAYRTRPITGESVCGDSCAVWFHQNRYLSLALADGLGHGLDASVAAEAAMRCIAAQLGSSCEVCFDECDRQLRHTRGVALALAIIDVQRNTLTLASVGNVRAVLISATGEHRLGGACGIVGAGFNNLAPETRPLAVGDVFSLYSDGLRELIPLAELARDAGASAEHIADAALARWATGSDDASILIYRHQATGFA